MIMHLILVVNAEIWLSIVGALSGVVDIFESMRELAYYRYIKASMRAAGYE